MTRADCRRGRTVATTTSCGYSASGSATETAARMYCHRNTVTYRLWRLQELAGRSPTGPVGASETRAVRGPGTCPATPS
ncbi:helix-turn-helix domain-containing protein [Streptomyces sp. NPDC003697]